MLREPSFHPPTPASLHPHAPPKPKTICTHSLHALRTSPPINQVRRITCTGSLEDMVKGSPKSKGYNRSKRDSARPAHMCTHICAVSYLHFLKTDAREHSQREGIYQHPSSSRPLFLATDSCPRKGGAEMLCVGGSRRTRRSRMEPQVAVEAEPLIHHLPLPLLKISSSLPPSNCPHRMETNKLVCKRPSQQQFRIKPATSSPKWGTPLLPLLSTTSSRWRRGRGPSLTWASSCTAPRQP